MNLEIVKPIVERLARGLARDWPGIECEDIAQEMFSAVAKQWKTIEQTPRDDWEKLITYRARKAGTRYATTERYAYQHHTTEWVYTPAEVRRVLAEHYFAGDSREDAPKRPEWGQQTLAGDGMSVVIWDIERGLEQLAEQEQTIIMRAYQCHESLFVTDRKRLQEAVDRLTSVLNRGVAQTFDHSSHNGPGAREVMSNASARALTTNNYERD